ncbi:MAG: Phosphoglycerate kinase [Parcubacteria group bacterium Gr01-1014_17]|nr:MAG: Phosphoglycerate kinase [Parcubacteria group bacterium Gr01-1014_17]
MTLNFKTIRDSGNLRRKRVFLAIDLNVPIQDRKVVDNYRITRSKKTLDFLAENGAHTLLVSHRTNEAESLAPVYGKLKELYPIVFAKTLEEARIALEKAKNGSFVLLENIRQLNGEQENEEAFAKKIASLADVYVNEAFSSSHRAYASIVGVPKFLPHYAGFLFEEEVQNLSKAFSPAHPFLFILGGAKFETKLPLIEKFLSVADEVWVMGALANDIFKARGEPVGSSRVSTTDFPNALLHNPKLRVPSDVVRSGDRIVDAGEKTVADIRASARAAKLIVWNGPLGEYERGFTAGTEGVARALAESGAETIVGGGDTLAAIARLGILEKFSFVSTGGGAMLEFLANETLPGLEVLRW